MSVFALFLASNKNLYVKKALRGCRKEREKSERDRSVRQSEFSSQLYKKYHKIRSFAAIQLSAYHISGKRTGFKHFPCGNLNRPTVPRP